ncbi:MAG: hypothetical protein MR607_07410 [Lachnospiraceae bacterium]|nr:hypothetical protein [Lachnospiraceae bacterium]
MYIVLLLIVIAIIAILISCYVHDPKFFARQEQKRRWNALQPSIRQINEIHDRSTGNGKKIGLMEKGKVKKDLATCKDSYVQYIYFCKEKDLDLPADYDHMVSVIEESEDNLDAKKALDRELERANKKYDETYSVVSKAGESLLEERNQSVKLVNDAEKLVNSIAKHPKEYDKDIALVKLQREKFKGTIEYAKEQETALKKSAGNAAAGAAAGVGVASLAPTAAMWVATTFGTASTGTAISALSGAAATNAALAWLGGGALAAGGGGMVAGQALLALAGPVGWGIAGASLLTSIIIFWNKKMKTQESKKDEILRIKNCTESLKEVKGKIDQISLQTVSLKNSLSLQIESCRQLCGKNYASFSEEQQMTLGALVNNAKSLSVLLNETVGS